VRRAFLLTVLVALAAAPGGAAQVLPPPPGGGGGDTEPPPPPPPAALPGPPGDAWTSFGGGPAQQSWSGDPALEPPFGVLWTLDLGGLSTDPIIADGKVFLGRRDGDPSNPRVLLEAYDARTGARAWSQDVSPFGLSSLAHAGGRLFSVDGSAAVIARSATTGEFIWRHEPLGAGGTAPVVVGDTVYLQGTRVFALDAATGRQRWRASIEIGAGGHPAVAGDRLFAAGSCTVAALDRRDGRVLWQHHDDCGGSPFGNVLLWRDRVSAYDTVGVRRAEDGASIGGPAPRAVVGDVGLTADGAGTGPMVAWDIPSGKRLWSAPNPASVLGLPHAVLSVGEPVESGVAVVARDPATGAERWGAKILPLSEGGGDRRQAGAGQGVVALIANRTLMVLGPAAGARPEPLTFALSGRPDRIYGEVARATGATGAVLAARRTRVEADEQPFRGDFRTLVAGATDAAGKFGHRVRLTRNARIRVVADDGRTTASETVFVYPRMRLSITQRGGLVRARTRIGAPKDVRLSRRSAALYLGRRGSRRLRRLDAARVVGRRATFVFAPLRRVSRRAFVVPCLRGAHRLGMGRADVLSRRCGARSIRL
jgi:outer membrane protein assembly factor BamB